MKDFPLPGLITKGYIPYIYTYIYTHTSNPYYYILYIFTTYTLPICLYTTYTTRLKLDRHYLCTTYILPYSTYTVYHLFGCTSYYIFPIQHIKYATPFPPQATPTGGLGDTMTMGGGRGVPRTWNIYKIL